MNDRLEAYRRRGERWEGWIAGMAPVQGQGTVDGRPWHFRARGNGWCVSIAQQMEDDPDLVGEVVAGWMDHGEYGTGFDASCMELDQAWRLVEAAFAKFMRGELQLELPAQR